MEELFKLGDLSEAEVEDIAKAAATVLDNKKGIDVKIIPVASKIDIVDYFVICSGGSNTQINALCDEVEKQLDLLGEKALHREGYRGGTWVLLDYGCITVHVFNEEAREFYSLERLWSDGVQLDLSEVLTAN